MSEEIVRCPYCVLGSEFRPMLHRPNRDWFVCASCGHMAAPRDPYLKCPCVRCREMSRVATRRRGAAELEQPENPDLRARA